MPRFALTLEFDGGPFFGFQRQKDGPSIQRSVEAAIHGVTGQQVALHSAGRTDAGVHAVAMRCHCDIDTALTPFRLTGAINAHLRPDPIAVTHCEVVPDDWHARFACIERRYLYRITNRRAPLALDRDRSWQITPQLDANAMHGAAQLLVGQHDFTTFRSAHCQSESPVKTLDRLDVEREGEEIRIHAAARSFLHHQVRSMVGCLTLVGRGRWSEEDLASALAARDRQRLGLNAPPHGLYFIEAIYPDEANQAEESLQERDR